MTMTKYKVYKAWGIEKPQQIGEFNSYKEAVNFISKRWGMAAKNMQLISPGYWVFLYQCGKSIRIRAVDNAK